MSAEGPKSLSEIQVDSDNLYREEVYTDLKIASIRVLTPMKVDGTIDTSRPVLYSGETQLMSQMGPVPVHAPIEAANLSRETLGDREARGVVLRAVDPEAGREPLERGGQLSLRSAQVALSVQRHDVGVDSKDHA